MRGHPRANGSASRWKKLSTYTQARSPPPRTPPPLPPPDLDEEGRVDNQRNTPRNTLPSPSNGSGPPQSSASDRIRLRSRDGWKGKSKPSSVFIVVSRGGQGCLSQAAPFTGGLLRAEQLLKHLQSGDLAILESAHEAVEQFESVGERQTLPAKRVR